MEPAAIALLVQACRIPLRLDVSLRTYHVAYWTGQVSAKKEEVFGRQERGRLREESQEEEQQIRRPCSLVLLA